MPVYHPDPARQAVRTDIGSTADPVVLGEFRYRALLGGGAWQALQPDVRRRFSKRLAAGESAVYAGQIEETRMNRTGWLLAQLCRLIGAPLPLERGGRGKPAVVTVTGRQGRRPVLDPAVRPRQRLPADRAQCKAVFRADRA